MPEATDAMGILRQNLVDAGCSPETVRQCAVLAQREESGELMRVLSRHRKTLLDAVHQNEKRIDCLDYLILILYKTMQSFYGAACGGPSGAAAKNVVHTFLGAPEARRRVTPP